MQAGAAYGALPGGVIRSPPSADEKKLIELLTRASDARLVTLLKCIQSWQFEGQADIYNWVPVLDKLQTLLRTAIAQCPRLIVVPARPSAAATTAVDNATADTVSEEKSESSGCTDDLEQEMSEQVYQVLRFTAILLENASNKHMYTSIETVVSFLGARNDRIVFEATHVLAMMTLPPHAHRHATDPSASMETNASRNSLMRRRLLTIAKGRGAANSSMDLVDYLRSSATSAEFAFQFYGEGSSSNETNTQVVTIRIPPIPTCDDDERSDVLGGPAACTAANTCEELIQHYHVPAKYHFSLFTKIRECYAARSKRSKEAIVVERMYALVALFYAFGESWEVTNYIEQSPELTRGIVELIRVETYDTIPVQVRVGALQVLTALVHDRIGRGGGIGVLGRQSNVLSILGVTKGTPHGVFPSLVRFCMVELGDISSKISGKTDSYPSERRPNAESSATEPDNDMDMSLAVAFVQATADLLSAEEADIVSKTAFRDINANSQDARLYWAEAVLSLLTAVVAIQSGAAVLTENGVIPSLLHVITTPAISPYHLTLITQCVQALETTVNNHASAAALYRDLNGVGILIDRLMVECSSISTLPSSGESFPPLSETTVVFLVALLIALSTSFHLQGVMTAGATSRVIREGSVLNKVLTRILGHIDTFGPVLFSQAAVVVSDVINNDPSSVNHVHSSGIADVLLKTLTRWDVAELYPSNLILPPCSQLAIAIPSVLNALSLTTPHADKVAKYDPLLYLLDMFASPQYTEDETTNCFQGDVPSIVGTGIFELVRHVPSFQNSAILACVKALQKITRFGEELVVKRTNAENGITLRMANHLADLLEPVLSKSEHAAFFADHGGIQLLLKLYHLILPTGSLFISNNLLDRRSQDGNISTSHHVAAQSITLALRSFASQQPTSMLTAITKEINMQLDSLKSARAAVGSKWPFSEIAEGAEGVLCSLPDMELPDSVGEKNMSDASEENSRHDQKMESVGEYLRVLATIEWQCALLIWTIQVVQSHLQCRRWFTEFSSKSTQQVISRLFSVDRSCQFERAKLASLHKSPGDVKKDTNAPSRLSDKKSVADVWKVGSLLLLRFTIVMRNLLSGYGKAFLSAPLRRGDENEALLAPHARALAKTVASVLDGHLRYVLSEVRANEIDEFTKQYYLTFLLETFVCCVIGNKKNHANTLVLVELMKTTERSTASTPFLSVVKTEHVFHQDENMDQEISTKIQGSRNDEVMPETQISLILNIIGEFFTVCLHAEKNNEGLVMPSKMDLSSFRVAARALRKLSDLSNISKSPLTSALIVNEESALPATEAEGRFDPRKLTVQLHYLCTRTLLAVWNHQDFINLPIEGCISEMLPVAATLLKNRLDRNDAAVNSAATGIESEFEFGRRQGFGFGRDPTEGGDIDSLSLRSALFGGSSSRLSGRANPRDFAIDPRVVESLTAMGFTSSRVEHAIRRIQVNDVELAMEWILSHPEEEGDDEEDMEDDTNVTDEVFKDDVASDSDAKTKEEELFELYSKLRDTYEQVCFSILQNQSKTLMPPSASIESKNASDELYRGQHFVMTVAEYLCFLCRHSDSERRLVISRLAGAILEWLGPITRDDVDRHRYMAMLAMLSHILALVLRLDIGSRAVLQEESPLCVQKMLDFVSDISSDSHLQTVVAPVLLAVGALVGDKTTADSVKLDQVVDAADSNHLAKHRELEFQGRLMNICMLLLKIVAAPSTDHIRNQVHSNIAHAIWQLLARLTLNYELASSFFTRGGIDDILSISDGNIFPGYCELTCTLLLQVMESPEVLQQMMEENILQAMSKLSTRYGSPSQMRFTPRALLMEVAPIAARNEELFLKALQNTICMKKSDSGRVYVVPKKLRQEVSSSIPTSGDPTALSHQPSDEFKDKKITSHHKIPKGHKHQAQMIIHKIIDKIQLLWEIEKTIFQNDDSKAREGRSYEDTQPVVSVGMYLRFLVHLVTFFPVCATVLAKAKYNISNCVPRDSFIRTVLMEFLPSKDLCQFAALRKSLREGGLYGSSAGLVEGGAEVSVTESTKFVDKRTRERVQNAHRLLVGIGSHSGEGSKCIILELVRLLQEWPNGTVNQQSSVDLDINISDELALSKLHAWSGLIMSILWPKGSSKGFAWDKVVLGGGLKGKHSFVTLLAEALRKINLAHPLAHATCSMLLRPLATLTRSFVTHRVRRLLKKRHSSSSENEALTLPSHSPGATSSAVLDRPSSSGQTIQHLTQSSSEITNSSGDSVNRAPNVSQVGGDIGDITMQSPPSVEDDHEMLDDDGGERSDDDDASERSSVSVRSTDDGDDDEEDEEDGDDDEDEDDEEEDDDDDDDEDDDDDDEGERMNLRSLRRRDESSANRRSALNRLWGTLDAELSILDALDEVDEEEFSYLNLLDDEASFADEQRRRIRRAARGNGSLTGSSEDNNSGRPNSSWDDERIVRSVMSANNLSSSGIDTQTDVIPFVSNDGNDEPEEQSGEPLPDTSRFLLGQRESAAGTAMLLQFIEDLPGVEDEFLFDSLDSRGARGHRSRSDHRHNRGATSGLDLSASSITHPLLRSGNTTQPADSDGDQMPDRLGLPRHSSLLRELQELTEHVQNQMPFSFGGSRARLSLGGIAREPLHRGGGGRARPPSRSNRLSAVSNLLSEFSLDIPASSQMRLHDSRIDSQRHYGLGANQVFGGHRASRGEAGDGNGISVWGPPGAAREVNIRSMVSRLEQRIGEVCADVTNDEQASSTRSEDNSQGNALANERQEQSDHNNEEQGTTQAENMVMDELTVPIDSVATEDTNIVVNVLDASVSDPATPDRVEFSEVTSETASVSALASTFGESSLQSPGDTDTDHNNAVAPTPPSHTFDTEDTDVHETESTSTAQDTSFTAPPPAPFNASSGPSQMMNFTLDLSSFQRSSSSAGSVSDSSSTAPDRTISSHEAHEESKTETEDEGSVRLHEVTITETTSGFVCPEGIDPEVFNSLPPDMQAEIIAQSTPANVQSPASGSVAATAGSESFSQMDLDMANSSFDRETLEALPADIRAEVLANERREREAAAAAAAEPADISRAQEMDNASFVASLAPELREEILVTCDDTFLQTLPSLVRAEAMVLRERVAFRSTYREPDHDRSRNRGAEGETGDLFRRPTLRRMLTSQGDDGLGGGSRRSGRRTFYSDGTIRRSSRRDIGHGNDRSYTGKLRVHLDEEEDENDRIFDDLCVKSLIRLLFMAQSVIHNRVFQRLLANICLYPLTRKSVRTNILRVISLPLDRPLISTAPEDKDDNFPPLALYGCSGSENRVFTDKEKLTIPGDVVNRTLHVLVSLAKYNPRFTVELLQSHGMSRTESLEVGVVSKTPSEDETGVAVLIELLALPVIYRNSSNLDALLELIELVLAPLQRFSMRKDGEEAKEEDDNADPSAAARERGEWISVPPLELDAIRMNELVRILSLDICTHQMQERTVAILRLLNRVTSSSNRQLVMDALVRQASTLAGTCRYETTANTTDYESSAVLRSAQDELQLLRLLHTLSDVCETTASFSECCRTIGLDPLWDALSASLEDARSNGGLEDVEATSTTASGMAALSPTTVDDDSSDGMVIEGKSAGASCAMAALLARFLPMVEAFFVVNARDAASMSLKMPDSLEREEAVVAALRLGGLDSAQPAPSEVATEAVESSEGSSLAPPRRSLSRTLSEPSETMRLANFVAANRVLLNTLVREKPSLLETSLAALIKMPRCRAYLDFDNKRTYFQSAMKRLRQTALRSHGGGSSSVRIPVRREHIFEDSYYALRMRSGTELRRKLHISFTGEEGIDAGGVTREWYMMLAREMFNPNYVLFTSAADSPTFQPNPLSYVNKDHLSYFEFVGKVLGKAVADSQLLDAHFTRSFYKHILQIPISYHDMEAIDPEYYRNLHAILDHPIADLGLDLTFSAENLNFGKVEIVDLIPNGRHIAVTDSNKLEYVQLVTHHRMATGIRQQIDAFLHGFHQLVPPEMIAIFNENELELLISGMPEIDIDDLKANTEYANFKPTDSVIRWFWNVLYTFTHEERALFLQFVTGTSKVPLEGFKALEGMRGTQKFNIHKAFGNPNALPSAHTCFNQLDLPEYESEEKLKQRLLLAIREGSEGFGFG